MKAKRAVGPYLEPNFTLTLH